MKKQYKALMLDVDGTTIRYDYTAMPTPKVVDALKKASKKVMICFVTGKSYNAIEPILKLIGLTSGYAIVNAGSHVVKLPSGEILYDQPINRKDVERIIEILRKREIPFYLKDGSSYNYQAGPFKPTDTLEKAYMVYTQELFSSQEADEIFKEMSSMSELTLHKSQHKVPQKYALNITHAKATKLHGVVVVLKEKNLKPEDIIGVGDSYNDFPLLMTSGLKVAMGNAVEDLKAIADYIAPSVDEDGVADVVEKFIL